jgi:hypothetical protein
VSDERTLEEQCYGVCWAAKERIAELEAGNATELRRLHAVNAELREALEPMKPLEVDIAAILHANLDSLYVEDPPAIAKAGEVQS